MKITPIKTRPLLPPKGDLLGLIGDVLSKEKVKEKGGKGKEKENVRLQAFEGLVLARKHGKEAGATFTVRRVASGVGMERIFPLYSPAIDKIEILRRAKVRRAKLYHIRHKAAKEISREMRKTILITRKETTQSAKAKEAREAEMAEAKKPVLEEVKA